MIVWTNIIHRAPNLHSKILPVGRTSNTTSLALTDEWSAVIQTASATIPRSKIEILRLKGLSCCGEVINLFWGVERENGGEESLKVVRVKSQHLFFFLLFFFTVVEQNQSPRFVRPSRLLTRAASWKMDPPSPDNTWPSETPRGRFLWKATCTHTQGHTFACLYNPARATRGFVMSVVAAMC